MSHFDKQAVLEAMTGRYPDFYGQFTPLKPQGGELRGACPLHGGDGPNFAVNPDTGLWNCFSGCQDGGDALRFLERLEGVSFPEALKMLADWAGISASKVPQSEPPAAAKKNAKQDRGSVVAQYDYVSPDGQLLFQSLRYEPKDAPKEFSQRRPDGRGGWVWNLGGIIPVLYHLPDVLAAVRAGEPVFVCEGEKNADALIQQGLKATTAPMGAKSKPKQWLEGYTEALAGANVVIMEDNDDAGRTHAWIAATALHGRANWVRVVSLPGLPEKGDVSDWLTAGGTAAALTEIVEQTQNWMPPVTKAPESERAEDKAANSEKKGNNPTTAELLVQSGTEASLFHSDRDEGFASFRTGQEGEPGHTEHRPLRSKPFRDFLCRKFYLSTGKPPNAQAMEDALRVLEGMARFDGPEIPLHVRTAQQDADLWIDLGDRQWRAVQVTAHGWQVVCDPPALFRRYAATAAHVLPLPGGNLTLLRPFLNVRDDAAWYQLVAWLVAAFLPDIAHPVLVVHGEQGSAKSSLMRMLSLLVDPSKTPLRTEPRDVAEWVQTADHCQLVTLDNVSHLPGWLSDALCRAVTGEGFVKRQLFTDAEDVVIAFRRVIALTGIEVVAQRADLLDRALLLLLEPITPEKRRLETEVLTAFEEVRPLIFGALLDTLSGVLRELPGVHLKTMPRMADFARVGVAVERALGWPAGTFITAYNGNVAEQHQEALSSSIIGETVLSFTDNQGGAWDGTAKDLLEALGNHAGKTVTEKKEWPKNAKALGGMMRRVAPNLRAVGIGVEFFRDKSRRTICLKKKEGYREGSENTVIDVTTSSETTCASENSMERVAQMGDSGDVNPARVTQEKVSKPASASHGDIGDGNDAKSLIRSDRGWEDVVDGWEEIQ